MKIQTTTNYRQFKEIKGNRTLNASHVKKLAQYLKIENFLPVNPIIVNENGEVIDGQHRLAAAKLIGAEVSFVVREGARLPEVILLNSVNKTWGLQDYLRSHIERGNATYQIIADFCKTYNLSVALGLEILGDHIGSTTGFKDGKFEIKNLKLSEEIAMLIKACEPYTERGVNISRDFVRAIMFLKKNKLIDEDLLLKKLSSQHEKFPKVASIRDALRRLEDIYNYRQRKKLVRFV